MTTKKKYRLPWEYCECGCHGHELNILGEYFWSRMDGVELTPDGKHWNWSNPGRKFTLSRQHGFYGPQKQFSSDEDLDKEVISILKGKKDNILKELKLLKALDK